MTWLQKFFQRDNRKGLRRAHTGSAHCITAVIMDGSNEKEAVVTIAMN
jgi:hypothetical protein